MDIDENDINRITALSPIREKAFFTVMRQSGLTPKAIKKLKIKNLEPSTQTSCKIDLSREPKEPPAFIGEEAIKYLERYLATRENLTPESLLFTAHDNPNKEIDTKDVSRTFRFKKEQLLDGKTKKLRLIDLKNFYDTRAKYYLDELENNPLKDDEFYRDLYERKALVHLEIESKITIPQYIPSKKISKRTLIQEMRQTIAIDKEYITSIYTLLYNNKGDYEMGENIELGDYFIELWKKTAEEQRQNMRDCWTRKTKLLPYKDILEELTQTLKRIIKPYQELKKTHSKK